MYAALTEREATQEKIFPGLSRLSRDVGVDKRQAQRYIDELEDKQLIRVIRRIVPGKASNDTNLYEFLRNPTFFGPVDGDVHTPIDGSDHTLWTNPSSRYRQKCPDPYRQKCPPNNTNKQYQLTSLEKELEKAAARIHGNHPAFRRDIGVGQIKKSLRAIIKRKALKGVEAITYLAAVADRHEGWSHSEQWTKDGGEFAKGLSNWLAPSMDRYEQEPPQCPAERIEPRGLVAGEIE